MKRILFATLVALAISVTYTRAQGCPSCFVVSWIDAPGNGDTVSNSAGWWIGGWGFLCESGHPVERVDVYYRGDDGYFRPAGATVLYSNLYRPDVINAFVAGCPNLYGKDVGWMAFPNGSVPPGFRELAINVWVGPYYQTHMRYIMVTP